MCTKPVANYERCAGCHQHRQLFGPALADLVVPLAYAYERKPEHIDRFGVHQSHYHLRAYKWDQPTASCASDLSVMLMVAIAFHRPCLEAAVGRRWDCWAVVPTSRRERTTEHPLATLVSGMPLNVGRVHLEPAGPPANDRQVRADRYWVPAPATVAGRHVVLFEDTWVSGSSAQSAAVALKAAGAAAVTIVCLARWLAESDGYPIERIFFEGLTTPYDAAVCPASGLICGQPR